MANKTTWSPNDTQKKFMEILKENPNGLTLREIKKGYGIEFKTGAINTLKTKGLVITLDEKREFVADIVYDNEIIGHKTYADTIYKLVG